MSEILIEVSELAVQLMDPDLIVLDTRFSLDDKDQGKKDYLKNHIPGAVFADLEQDLSGDIIPGRTGRHPLPDTNEFAATLSRWGMEPDSHIVIYDQGNHAMASRAWWLLHWAGCRRVQVLHGGYSIWLEAGHAVTDDITKPSLTTFSFDPDLSMVVTANDIAGLRQYGHSLIDARGQERFDGLIEPLDALAGHIPGAVCLPFPGNLDETGRFLSSDELQQRFQPYVREGQMPICYCGSGVTACHNLLAMRLAGYEMGLLYPGSWSEWITDSKRLISISD